MSSVNSVRKLQILYFSMKIKEIKNLKNSEKKWPDIGIYTYYSPRAPYQVGSLYPVNYFAGFEPATNLNLLSHSPNTFFTYLMSFNLN